MTDNKITIIQGGQYGSEAKGQIAAIIAEREGVNIAVRTGATNAGHTVYYKGKPVKMQQLPTAWVVPSATLVVGAGALIDIAILERECAEVTSLTGEDIKTRLFIDYRAGVHDSSCAERSKASGRHHAIGATGKGCSEALIDRIRGRGTGYKLFGHRKEYQTCDTAAMLNNKYDAGEKILLEGTQGTLLDLYLGPYPFTTHKQTGPAQWLLEAGLSPSLPLDIVSVIRTYPIRVAGNSGPLPLEISWPFLARQINSRRRVARLPPIIHESKLVEFVNEVRAQAAFMDVPPMSVGTDMNLWSDEQRSKYKIAASELHARVMASLPSATVTELARLFEFTTVTKKLRRVGELSLDDLRYSSMLTRPHRVAVTFMNYEFPEYWYETPEPGAGFNTTMTAYVDTIQRTCGAPVCYLGFGPESAHHVAYRR